MNMIIEHHIFLFLLGVLLFFIVNFIGKYSKNFGYSDIKFGWCFQKYAEIK